MKKNHKDSFPWLVFGKRKTEGSGQQNKRMLRKCLVGDFYLVGVLY